MLGINYFKTVLFAALLSLLGNSLFCAGLGLNHSQRVYKKPTRRTPTEKEKLDVSAAEFSRLMTEAIAGKNSEEVASLVDKLGPFLKMQLLANKTLFTPDQYEVAERYFDAVIARGREFLDK